MFLFSYEKFASKIAELKYILKCNHEISTKFLFELLFSKKIYKVTLEVVGHRIDQFSWRLYPVRHKWLHNHKHSLLRIRYQNRSIFSAWQPKLDPTLRVARYNLDSRDLIYRQSNDSYWFFQTYLCIYYRTFRYWIPLGSPDLQFFHLLQNWRVKYREL